jgi:large subunit ribosomal protein L30e
MQKPKKRKRTSTKVDFDSTTAVRVALRSGKALIGSKSVLRQMAVDTMKMIVIARNTPQNIRDSINAYNRVLENPIPIYQIDMSSWDLGAIGCGKPYMVTALGILEEGESQILKAPVVPEA